MAFRDLYAAADTQPQDERGASPEWLQRGLVALFDCRRGIEVVLSVPATTDLVPRVASTQGIAPDFSNLGQVYPHRPQYAVTSPLSILIYCDVDALTNSGDIIGKGSGTFTTDTPYGLKLGVGATDSRISLLRGGSGGGGGSNWYMTASASNTFSAPINAIPILVVDPLSTLQGTRTNWANGAKYSATQVAGLATGNQITDGGGPVYIGRRDTVQLDGRIYFIALFNRALTDDEALSLTNNPWQVFAEQEIFVPAAAALAYTLTANNGSFTTAGQSVSEYIGRNLTGNNGTYTSSGYTARLTPGAINQINVQTGTFAVSGQPITFLYGRRMDVQSGSYTLAGQNIDFGAANVLFASSGSYSTTGQTASLKAARRLGLSQGTYTTTGYGIDTSTAKTLYVQRGLFAVSGQGAGLNRSRTMNLSGGSYATTGRSITVDIVGATLYAGTGSFGVVGSRAALNYSGAPDYRNFAPVGGSGINVQYLPVSL